MECFKQLLCSLCIAALPSPDLDFDEEERHSVVIQNPISAQLPVPPIGYGHRATASTLTAPWGTTEAVKASTKG